MIVVLFSEFCPTSLCILVQIWNLGANASPAYLLNWSIITRDLFGMLPHGL
jgi:hypothetical protein